MSRRFVGGLAAVLVFLGVWYYRPVGWPIANVPPTSPVIVVFGDSLAHGDGAPRPDTQGPAALLETRYGRPVVNLGQAGATTEDGLRRLVQLKALQPGLVIVSLGGNDYLQRRPRDETFKNLRRIVDELQATGAAVCIIGMEPPASFGYSYSGQFKELARTTGSALVHDALDGILDRPTMRADSYHPNKAGYELLAERIGKVIDPIVAQMPAPPAKP